MVTPMAYALSFLTKNNYDTTKIGITVPVELAGLSSDLEGRAPAAHRDTAGFSRAESQFRP